MSAFKSWCIDGKVPLTVYDSGRAPGPAALLINAYGMPFDAVHPLALKLVRRGYRVVSWDCRISPGESTAPVHVVGVPALGSLHQGYRAAA